MKTTTIHHEIFGNLEVIQEGEKVFFPATWVATLLGYALPEKAIRTHCLEEGCPKRTVLTKGGQQEKKYITEGNLYRLIVRSKLPQAVAFERWVFDEVLPQLRKDGLYMTEETTQDLPLDPEAFLAKALQIADKKIKSLESQVEDAEHATSFLASYVETKDLYTIRETAKLLGIRERAFIALMEEKKYLYRINGSRLLPHHHLTHEDYAQVKTGFHPISQQNYHQTLFTAKGIEWLSRILKQVSSQ